MRDEIRQIIGKTIKGVITTDGNTRPPRSQVFLVFEDDTYYEIYGDIGTAGGVDRGGEEAVMKYIRSWDGRLKVYFQGRAEV